MICNLLSHTVFVRCGYHSDANFIKQVGTTPIFGALECLRKIAISVALNV